MVLVMDLPKHYSKLRYSLLMWLKYVLYQHLYCVIYLFFPLILTQSLFDIVRV